MFLKSNTVLQFLPAGIEPSLALCLLGQLNSALRSCASVTSITTKPLRDTSLEMSTVGLLEGFSCDWPRGAMLPNQLHQFY